MLKKHGSSNLVRGLSIFVPLLLLVAAAANAATRNDDPAVASPFQDGSYYPLSRDLPEPGEANEFLPSEESMETARRLQADRALAELKEAVASFPFSIRLPQFEAGTTLDRANSSRQVLPDGSTFHTIDLRLTLPSEVGFHMWQAENHQVLVDNGKPLLNDVSATTVRLGDHLWERLVHPDDPSLAIYNAVFADGSVVTVDFPKSSTAEALLASIQALNSEGEIEKLIPQN